MSWDGRFEPDSRPAALFALLRPALYRAIFADGLGEDLPALLAVAGLSYGPLDAAVRDDRSSFWDDRRTPGVEGPAHAWARALREAREELRATQPELGGERLDGLLAVTSPMPSTASRCWAGCSTWGRSPWAATSTPSIS